MKSPNALVRPALFGIFVTLTGLIQARSQTVIVDNFSQTTNNFAFISSTDFVAHQFTTDGQSYALGTVNLNLRAASNGSGNFVVQLWDDNAGAGPGNLLRLLNGNGNPIAAGVYTYTPFTPITLTSATPYWITLSVSSGNGAYGWNSTTTSTSSGPGTIGGFAASFDSGANWLGPDPSAYHMFSVTGSPVPEPQTYALAAGLALLGFATWRRAMGGIVNRP